MKPSMSSINGEHVSFVSNVDLVLMIALLDKHFVSDSIFYNFLNTVNFNVSYAVATATNA